jgi:murein DD-endopeptidase MepM/ murein hydrolase activator NlpD
MVTPQILGVFTEAIPENTESWFGGQKELIEYIVKSGDTLSSIADKFDISLNTILWANELDKNSVIKPGQKLLILPVSGVLHYVKTGDTLSAISQTYKGKIEDIIAFNELSDENIYPGDIIIIPDGKMPAKPFPVQYPAPSIPLPSSYFLCPIPLSNGVCQITQGLHYYNAVDFSTGGFSCGQPVFAAASGEVLKIKYGYNFGAGNYIRILHLNGLITHYGHLSKILVSIGQKVSRGDIIGLIGYSGYTIPPGPAGCHLHFGVYSIDGQPPLNPFKR